MTIYALSSGPGVSGIAVIRISGADTSKAIELLHTTKHPKGPVTKATPIPANKALIKKSSSI